MRSMSADFLSDLCYDAGTEMSPERVMDFFVWSARLGIVHQEEHGYRLDSSYAAGFARVFEE